MPEWQSISRSDFERFLNEELASCHPEERALFERTRTRIERRPLVDDRFLKTAFVVACYGGEVMYYNDIEGGFNTSPLTDEGSILEYWCNQDNLQGALHTWLTQRRS